MPQLAPGARVCPPYCPLSLARERVGVRVETVVEHRRLRSEEEVLEVKGDHAAKSP